MANRRSVPQIVESISPASCTVDHRLEVLRGLPFFHDLSHERLEEINRQFRSYDVEAGATIYMSGDRTERLYVVAHGRVKLLRHSASGEDTVLDILATGEMFGTLAALGDEAYTVVSPFSDLDSPIVVTSWGKQLAVESADDPSIAAFLDEYRESPDAPEPGAPCTGG